MPMSQALRLCPDAIVVSSGMSNYSEHSRNVTKVIDDHAPLYQKASIDEFYVDLTGMDEHFGCVKWAKALRERIIKETKLPISTGLGTSRLIAKMCTNESKPDGFGVVYPGEERSFIAKMPVGKIPGIGKQTQVKLKQLGIHSIEQLANFPEDLLVSKFGKYGRSMRRRAQGIDHSPIVATRERKSISTERTFHEDISSLDFLLNKLTQLTVDLAYSLRKKKKSTACVSIKIRYKDFSTFNKQMMLASHTNSDSILLDTAKTLFHQLYNPNQAVRLIGIRFDHLFDGELQYGLFDDSHRERDLLDRLDHIRNKFGKHSITRGTSK